MVSTRPAPWEPQGFHRRDGRARLPEGQSQGVRGYAGIDLKPVEGDIAGFN
jgi:hypothetical protein